MGQLVKPDLQNLTMLLLTNTTHKLQLVTSAAGAVSVHTSWVDVTVSTGAITPGSQNTASITSIATTDTVPVPGAGVTRNVQTQTVRNTHASVANTVTVQHTDGTNVEPLFSAVLAAGESLQFVDGDGFSVFASTGARKFSVSSSGQLIKTTILTSASGTHTTDPATRTLVLRLVAGGGAGGGAATVASGGGCGGGGAAGGNARKTFSVSGGTGYSYTCGAAGAAGAAGANPGGTGGNTTFTVGATTVTAFGGLGGTGMAAGTTVLAALGGSQPAISTNGDINGSGAPGLPGIRLSGTVGVSGAGGSSVFGAGDEGLITQGNGAAGTGFGAGGSGGVTLNAGAATSGGAGVAGCILAEEYS